MEKEKQHFTFRVNFITLTLSASQEHSDKEIKQKLLQPFIRILRNRHGVRNYIWKAEAQDNDRIHFHITCDQFIHYDTIRQTWNTLQETLGYITRSGLPDPNSTDIHSVKNIKNLAGYMANYLGKKDLHKRVNKEFIKKHCDQWKSEKITTVDLPEDYFQQFKRKIEGKLWDCNEELKKINCLEQRDTITEKAIETARASAAKIIHDQFVEIIILARDQIKREKHLQRKLNNEILKTYVHSSRS